MFYIKNYEMIKDFGVRFRGLFEKKKIVKEIEIFLLFIYRILGD